MFAIYDVRGRQFRDTLERLQALRAMPARQHPAEHPRDPEQAAASGVTRLDARADTAGPVSDRARQAYRAMLRVSEREAIVHAHQLMSHPVTSVPLTVDIMSAWRQMREHHFHQLPVLDARQRLVGMVSERDLLRFLLIEDAQVSYVDGKTVADAMSAQVIAADPVTDVRRIAHVMLTWHLSAVPVVDERDTLIGLVSRSDILRSVAQDPPLSLWS